MDSSSMKMNETGYELAPYDTAVTSPQATASSPADQAGKLLPTTAHTDQYQDGKSYPQEHTTSSRQFDILNVSHSVVTSQLQSSDVFKLNAYNQDYDITPVECQGTEEPSRVPLQKMELDKAEHPWMRPSKVEGVLSEEERETERLFRKLQGILNKLTPQKFQILAEQALKLKIDSQQKLNGCADRIIANAVKGPKYCIAYANLCKVMSTIKVVESTTEDDGRRARVITFRRVLLSKVQQEFEKDKKDDEEREGLLMAAEAAQDPERKQQLRDRVKDLDARNLKQSLGIMHFIGELFKLKMLSETIMHECLVRLLRSSSDTDTLECFARLLTVTGKDVDRPEAKSRMDQYFSRISEIIRKGRIPLRIKFILQDVQELRANKWIPRRIHQDYSLKTISQIHREARIEEEKEKQLVAQFVARSKKHNRVRNRTSRQDYLRSSDWHYGQGGRSKEREGYELPAKGKLQDAREVELHKTKNPWTRAREVEEDFSGEKELFRKFQGILNKLTPQKFQVLAEQALMLKIDSEQRLKGCIDQIFNVMLKDPKYSIAYASLCKVMSTLKVEIPTEEGKVKVITFRRVLLTKFQQVFESEKNDEEIESMLNTIKEEHDPAKKRQLEQELKTFEAKNHEQSMNNIRFLGELFKLKMLSETIMHECIVRLLRSSSDEDSLETCAILITTTGQDLDHPEAKARMDQYFTRISEIIIKGKIPLRIKFMLQDLHDLRTNNWISHQIQEDSLKTIDQIHHEAKVEEEKRKQLVCAKAQNKTHSTDAASDHTIRPVDDMKPSDGGIKKKLDARKLQVLLKQRRSDNRWQHQPLGVATLRPTGWGRGTKSREKYSASGAQAVQSTVNPHWQQHQPARGVQKYIQGQEVDELAAITLKTMAIVDKLIEAKDLEAASSAMCVYEMNGSDEMISMAINHCLEKSRQHRQSYGHIFSESIKEQVISKEHLVSGLNKVLECAHEILIDVPNLWDYFAEFLSPIVFQCTLSLSFLSSVPMSILSSGEAGLLAVKILALCSKHLSSDNEVATILWANSSLEWSALGVSSEDLPTLLSRHGLEYLLGTNQPQQADSQHQLQQVAELTRLFSNHAITNDDIIDWIESHYSPPVLNTPDFVTTMTTAVVNASMLDSGERGHFHKQHFSRRVTCLERYVENDECLQMRVLCALQVAVDKLKHPRGILNYMFNTIYDQEIIRGDVFRKWRDSESEGCGKGRAVLSVKSFFDWLDS